MGDHYFGITDRGRVRDNNEDAYLVDTVRGSQSVIAAVIDGVGGYEGGEVAAAIARESIASLLTLPLSDAPAVLREALHEANKRIIGEKQAHPGHDKMACVLTLALADTANNQFHYAHVGDTRLYLLREKSLVKVTKDHSFVGFLEDSSRITETDAMRHPKRNEINRALGFDPTIPQQQEYVETGSSPFLPGDILLLCSDGLTDMISRQEITDILTSNKSIAAKAQSLVDAANSAGGRDNITVVLVQHPKQRQALTPTPPSVQKSEATPGGTSNRESIGTSPTKKRGAVSPIVWILLLACAGLMAALIWQMNRLRPVAAVVDVPVPASTHTTHPRNPTEQQFLDSLNSSTGMLLLDSTLFSSPVMISDSLVINKDSFHLSGNGVVLRRDSAQSGPAIILPSTAKYVFLENIVFENFPIAIQANSNALRLSNVRFLNCDVPVSYQLHIANGAYTRGFIHEGMFFKTDSLPDNHKAWQ